MEPWGYGAMELRYKLLQGYTSHIPFTVTCVSDKYINERIHVNENYFACQREAINYMILTISPPIYAIGEKPEKNSGLQWDSNL